MDVTFTAPTSPQFNSHDCHHKERSTFDPIINVIEKVSAFALGFFAASVSLKSFLPFFFMGVCIGAYTYTQDKKTCGRGHPVFSCANGLLEQLTGVKLPRLISLAVNVAVTVCHIDHHASVFVPVIGISVGTWIGNIGSHYCSSLISKTINVFNDEAVLTPPLFN